MTDKDKLSLLYFLFRPHLFIRVVDENTLISFITGYEIGNRQIDFTEKLGNYLDTLKLVYSRSDGWTGKITRYSTKKSISWETALIQIGIEILAQDGLTEEMRKIIKERVFYLVECVKTEGSYSFNDWWITQCICYFPVKSEWFKILWSAQEFKVLKSIMALIKKGQIFEDSETHTPTKSLLNLTSKFKTIQEEISVLACSRTNASDLPA